jgi:hypothetical protein
LQLKDLDELQFDKYTNYKSQKHSKKDYDILKTIDAQTIINLTKVEKKKVMFEDEEVQTKMVKVQKKK